MTETFRKGKSLSGWAREELTRGGLAPEKRRELERMANDVRNMNEEEFIHHMYVRSSSEHLKRADFSTEFAWYDIKKKEHRDVQYGVFSIDSLSYYTADSVSLRLFRTLFPPKEFGQQFDYDAYEKAQHANFSLDMPLTHANIDGDLIYFATYSERWGFLRLRSVEFPEKSIYRNFPLECIIPSSSLFPNCLDLEEHVNNMNNLNKRISFYGKDMDGMNWSIHCKS